MRIRVCASSALGRAALNLTVEAGAAVMAATWREEKFAELRVLRAKEAVLKGQGMPERLLEGGVAGEKLDAVLELLEVRRKP